MLSSPLLLCGHGAPYLHCGENLPKQSLILCTKYVFIILRAKAIKKAARMGRLCEVVALYTGGLSIDDHWNGGMREHLLRFAAEQQPRQSAPPVRGHEMTSQPWRSAASMMPM
jgi:hypothetical protein